MKFWHSIADLNPEQGREKLLYCLNRLDHLFEQVMCTAVKSGEILFRISPDIHERGLPRTVKQ